VDLDGAIGFPILDGSTFSQSREFIARAGWLENRIASNETRAARETGLPGDEDRQLTEV